MLPGRELQGLTTNYLQLSSSMGEIPMSGFTSFADVVERREGLPTFVVVATAIKGKKVLLIERPTLTKTQNVNI